jgi:hypothetical protein
MLGKDPDGHIQGAFSHYPVDPGDQAGYARYGS